MTIILYRGDSTSIDSFDVKKASPYALLGKGIYLTDSRDVAKTYRIKDNHLATALYEGKAANKPEALQKAFQKYAEDQVWRHPNNVKNILRGGYDKHKENIINQARREWNNLLEGGKITCEYDHNKNIVVKFNRNYILEGSAISQFLFSKEEFESKIFKFSGICSDEEFVDFIKNQTAFIKRENEDHRKKLSKFTNVLALTAPTSLTLGKHPHTGVECVSINEYGLSSLPQKIKERINKHLKSRGFKGLEYAGGVITHQFRHRAFVVWDDEWVNEHRVY